MPFSSTNGKHATDRIVKRFANRYIDYMRGDGGDRLKVLDVGVGCGTYRDRYKDILNPDVCEWTGVEVWKPYVEKYNLDKKYERIVIEDIRKHVLDMTGHYNIIFVGDILEHMTKEEAIKVMSVLVQHGHMVILAIPIVHYPQPAFEGNPFEEHIKDDWSHQEVVDTWHQHIKEWAIEGEIGVYFMGAKDVYPKIFDPRIGVYGICKNEEKTIDRTIESIREADAIVVCDTGSIDKTKWLLASSTNNSNGNPQDGFKVIDISVQPWRFDEARNTAMMMLPDDLDLVVSIDMDEYMQEGWYTMLCDEVRKHYRERGRTFDLYHHRFSTEWDWETVKPGEKSKNFSSHWHSRIHTRHNWKWALPVHEVLDFTGDGQQQECFLGGLTMYQRPITKESRGTYLPLLEISLKERPGNWKSWFFYANEQYMAQNVGEAKAALLKAMEIPGADKAHLFNALASYETDEAIALSYYMQACTTGNQREYWCYFARWCMNRLKWNLAQECIDNARKFNTPSSGYQFNASCWGTQFEVLAERIKEKV